MLHHCHIIATLCADHSCCVLREESTVARVRHREHLLVVVLLVWPT